MRKYSLRRGSKNPRGFTLIELAIVMTIFVVAISGIMAAAESFYYRREINLASDEMNQIVANIRSYYSGRNTSPLAGIGAGPFTTNMINVGAFPVDVTASGVPNNPWNATSAAATLQVQLIAAGQLAANQPPVTQFSVIYKKVPLNVCADFIMRNSEPGVDNTQGLTLPGANGLSEICINNAANTCLLAANGQLPILAAAANAACAGPKNITITLYYNLGS